jgi:RNA polymerase sigma-70 factor, ECF subfamily
VRTSAGARASGTVIGEEFAGLLAAAQGGSEAAFARLWRNANPALLRYLRVIAAGAEEDIAAETWVQVVRGLSAFRGDERAWRAWLFTTARRRAIDLARHRSRRPEAPLDDLTAAQLPGARDSAEAALENLSTAAAIALVSGLPRLQAEVILLRVVAGLDTELVARLLHKSPGSVRVAAHRGLRRLAEITAGAGVTL